MIVNHVFESKAMRFYSVNPEVPGQLGAETELDTSVHPPIVKRLHIEFDGWPSDSILTCFPTYFVTEDIRRLVEVEGLSGARFEPMIVTESLVFEELYPGRALPRFWRLIPIGKFLHDDFSLSPNFSITLSERALKLLQIYGLENAEIEEVRR